MGLYEPDEGTITIDGVKPSDIPDEIRRRVIGVVEQDIKRLGGRLIDEITLYDDSITVEDVEKALDMVGLKEKVLSLEKGLYTESEESLFSLGEWQLISCARAVVTNPEILLLDEMTSSLDSETERRVLEAIERLSKGRTVISISHRLYNSKGYRIVAL